MKANFSKLWLAMMVFVLSSSFAIAQTRFRGQVIDGETNQPLMGATIVDLKDTKNGASSDIYGFFHITLSGKGSIKISFLGFNAVELPYDAASGRKDFGKIVLQPDSEILSEVVVVGKGVIDLASNRVTPIAATVVNALEIQAKAVGNVEFPEVMKNTPNIYVANQAGGYGDSQMFLRGFDQSNTAFLLNGQPINGMEDGKMYWSNWAGMSDIANAIDVQRGLGSSKLAISSVGGTINIVTKATELNKGGFVRALGGYGNYWKGTVAYNTGLMDNGWGVSVLFDAWYGERKWNDGTQGSGQNYFLSIGKRAGNHLFNYLIFGAPQWHNQNFGVKQEKYDKYGMKYNPNWGKLNGKVLNERKNYYHKPVMNFNWDWNINEKNSLSTVLYASFGRGGGTGSYGNGADYIKGGRDEATGLINWDYIVGTENPKQADGYGYVDSKERIYKGTGIRSSVNNHQWYGIVTNYGFDNKKNFSFNAGADFRFYKGDHFRQLVDLMGLKGFVDEISTRSKNVLDASGKYLVENTYPANPWAALFNYAPVKNRIAYNNSEWINYQGAFSQAEYHTNLFSVFFQGALSNQSYQKWDQFVTDGEKSKVYNRIGYNVKGGFSFTFADSHTLFVNSGYYSRQPFLDNMFEYGTMEPRKMKVENENIIGFEAGYAAKLPGYTSINLNFYYTNWANRFLSFGMQDYTTPNTKELLQSAGFRMYNVSQIHKGMELEVRTQPTVNWMFRGYFTYGDWRYAGKTPIDVIDEQGGNRVADNFNVELSGTKVGDAPQSTFGLGTEYKNSGFKIYADYNHYFNLYSAVDIKKVAQASVKGEKYQSDKLNNYGLLDLGASYRWALQGKQGVVFRANVYNVLNKKYVAAQNNYGLYYGPGTTFNFGVTYEF